MKISPIFSLLSVSVLCKILFAYFIPVFGDEAYYYIWSLHPQLSYFDHPPMVSWFIFIGHLLFPAGNALSLRFIFILASLITSILWVKILQVKNFNDNTILMWLLLFFLNPLLGVGSVLATPDTPLVLFWTLSFLCFLKMLKSNSLLSYSLLGVFLGLGFCSKYHIVLFVLSGLIYLIFSKKIITIKPGGVFMTVLFGFLFSLPVIIWNAQNNWSSFIFQIKHGFGEESFEWTWPAGFIIAQIIIINPVILYSFFQKSYFATDRVFSLSQLSFFFVSSFKSVVEGNWPLTSHLHSITHFSSLAGKKLFKFSFLYWLVFYFLAGIFFISPLSQDVKKNLVNSSQLDEIFSIIKDYRPLYGPSYQVASLLSWKSQLNIAKLSGLSRLDFYDSLPESQPSESLFFVLKYDISDWPDNYAIYKKIKIRSFDNIGLALYQFSYE